MSASLSPDAIRSCAFTRSTPGDELRDRMLDLDAGVHLDEVQPPVFIHQKLDGPGVLIADFGQAMLQRAPDLIAHLRRDLQGGRFFNQFLMAALDGAFALKESGDVAVLIGQHLELDVAGLLDELLHVELAVAESICRFGRGRVDRGWATPLESARCACRVHRRRPWPSE